MEFDISYTSKEITPWGGMVFLKQMLQKTGFRELIDQNTDLPQSGSNRGYKPLPLLRASSPVSGVVPIGFYIQKLPVMIVLWVKYSTGKIPLDKILTNGFSANLHRLKTIISANIFTRGFLIISSLIILH